MQEPLGRIHEGISKEKVFRGREGKFSEKERPDEMVHVVGKGE